MVENNNKVTVIPQWLRRYLDEAGAERISAAVQKAEATTCGEIVPVLVRRSVEQASTPVIGALLMLVIALAVHYAMLNLRPEWNVDSGWALFITLMTAAGYGLGLWPPVGRLLIARRDQINEVHRRAMLAFYETGVPQTQGKTGILLFVSFFERQAVVLGDKGIADKIGPEAFKLVVDDLIAGARDDNIAKGFENAIRRCGEVLAAHFPPDGEKRNQIKDDLRILN